ncbi:TetR/AcrR family transcriptional regulator [Rhodoferax aquaticus]|uniref:TetR/AcrR family transcriptional regulator n=2 Tax=Rhodoferax aquaticus TaxID=2527691 RepID=A0A515EW06_9BURK|nr:TetR/AcrR family transcriptional regulator [Rhodoferax aquaticus]
MTSAKVAVPAKAMRSDGLEARNRLLDAALALFAEKGFAKTSTREIALAAQVNIASISYYFGDKEGLYRAVFADPRSNPNIDPADLDGPHIGLEQALSIILRSFVEPMKQGHLMQQCMKLHFREMLEPTGVWQEEIDTNIKPAHAALVAALGRHLGVVGVDDDLHRLAFAISSLGMMLHVGSDVYSAICPQLVNSHAAIDLYSERLTAYAMALVEAEAKRRACLVVTPEKPSLGKPNASPIAKAKPKSPSLKRTSSL